jgi:pimeloyl-ACP methyl ester carboxylesterase
MLAIVVAVAVSAASIPLSVPGPQAPLAGTFLDAGKGAPVVLIIPGSGPTDRDGNSPLGITAAPYRLFAEALAARGVSTLRADKRGMFGSKSAVSDPNAVTLADYAGDAHQWARMLRTRTGTRCIWLLGHSEGGLIALEAAQHPSDLCGLILVAAPGRKLGIILREQLRANPANAPILPQAFAALDSLESGKPVNPATLHPGLQSLFNAKVQPYLMELLRADPARLAASAKLPMLIVRGGKDIQVAAADAAALRQARPDARTVSPSNMNHVLKDVASDDRTANLVTYADPSLPVDQTLVSAVADFVKK